MTPQQVMLIHYLSLLFMQVWTYQNRVAFVLSVTEKGKPVENVIKLQRLQQLVQDIMDCTDSEASVSILKVRGEIHHDRRLHQLMLGEERYDWERLQRVQQGGARVMRPRSAVVAAAPDASVHDDEAEGEGKEESASPTDSAMSVHENGDPNSPFRSPKYAKPLIDISHCSSPDYWTVTIRCRDRTKLLFDTVCTLADMHYDIYHATIDSTPDGGALQEYYVRPRSGDVEFSDQRAALLKAMLEGSIQRRFPKGLKVHVRSLDRFGCLAALAQVLRQADLSVTRAKVRTFATSNSSGHTLYVMDANGGPPDRMKVQQACQKIGGKLVEGMQDAKTALDQHHFSFSFLQRQWNSNWGGSPAASSSNGSI